MVAFSTSEMTLNYRNKKEPVLSAAALALPRTKGGACVLKTTRHIVITIRRKRNWVATILVDVVVGTLVNLLVKAIGSWLGL